VRGENGGWRLVPHQEGRQHRGSLHRDKVRRGNGFHWQRAEMKRHHTQQLGNARKVRGCAARRGRVQLPKGAKKRRDGPWGSKPRKKKTSWADLEKGALEHTKGPGGIRGWRAPRMQQDSVCIRDQITFQQQNKEDGVICLERMTGRGERG